MKRSTLVLGAAAAAVLVAGGAFGAYALTSGDDPEPVETPAAVETVVPTEEPSTEPTPTEDPAPVETATPEPSTEPTPTYSEGEAFLIRVTHQDLPHLALTDEQILEAAAAVCASPEAGSGVPYDAFDAASADQQLQFRVNAQYHVCG